jgi:hypothetical protein
MSRRIDPSGQRVQNCQHAIGIRASCKNPVLGPSQPGGRHKFHGAGNLLDILDGTDSSSNVNQVAGRHGLLVSFGFLLVVPAVPVFARFQKRS